MIDITYRIQEACDNGQFTCGIYVYFKKAFDTVNHNILLDKLAHYGVTESVAAYSMYNTSQKSGPHNEWTT